MTRYACSVDANQGAAMTTSQPDLWGGDGDKVRMAIERLRTYEPPEGYYLAFSGGKDSQTIYHLAQEAGVKFEPHYAVTTVDPPELLRFIREHYPEVVWDRPERGMYRLIVDNRMPPTRLARYCCKALKEDKGLGRCVVTGIRAEESRSRAARPMVEACRAYAKRYLHPIIDWTAHDVWQYHRERGLPHCQLYDEGFERIGCVMCPMAGQKQRLASASRWPRMAAMYRRACDAAYARRLARGDNLRWQNGDDMYNWWVHDITTDKGQMRLFEDGDA